MNNTMRKSKKEIFDEEIKNWPDELEKIAEEANKKYGLITENINSLEDFLKYAEKCIPWEEYKKEWLK